MTATTSPPFAASTASWIVRNDAFTTSSVVADVAPLRSSFGTESRGGGAPVVTTSTRVPPDPSLNDCRTHSSESSVLTKPDALAFVAAAAPPSESAVGGSVVGGGDPLHPATVGDSGASGGPGSGALRRLHAAGA